MTSAASSVEEIVGKLKFQFQKGDDWEIPERLREIDITHLIEANWRTIAFAALEWAKAPHSEPVTAGHYLAFHPDVDLRGAEIRIRVGEKSFRDIGTLTLEE